MNYCIGKLRGCVEFRRGRWFGCRLFVGTRRLQGCGQIHCRRGIGCTWPRGNALELNWLRAGNSTLSQVLRLLYKRQQRKKRFGIRSRARIRGRLLVLLDRRHQDRLVGLQLGRPIDLSNIG